MDNQTIELYRELVLLDGDESYTTSMKIAERFKRPHSNVLRTIGRLDDAIKSRKSLVHSEMFKAHTYTDARGKTHRSFLVSKDGFMMLAMRFDGADAFDWQLNFIAAFNWLLVHVRELEDNARLMAQFDIKNRASIADGSYHGTGLQQRKVEKIALSIEEDDIKAKVQASLMFNGASVLLN